MSFWGSSRPPRDALDFGPRPDPALGIFETMLVRDGELPMRDAHYARINASARELYGVELLVPVPTGPQAVRRWNGHYRLMFVPGDGLELGGLGFPTRDPDYTGVAPFTLPGGLGPHKWLDRHLVDALAAAADGALPLLIDTDGSVLEATWANVLIEERGRLVSPPDDGRALSGIGRRALRYDEEPVDLDRLLAADAVVLSSALRVIRIPRKAASGR
jgi:para-aminobenzoate synthetase/4-amino-4-deoxychorismate lyase